MANPIPVWLDADPGHDDAFAILFAAHHPAIQLLGMSTVHGNASLAKTTQNALSILEAIGRPEVPVFPGARKPLCREPRAAPDIHGESGLDGTTLLPRPHRSALSKCTAVLEMHDALEACPPNTAWIVATGALTNISLLFAIFPHLVHHIRGLSIMGGAIGNGFTTAYVGPVTHDAKGQPVSRVGNVTPRAEFNTWCDPEAAESLFQNPPLSRKITLIPLDVTHQALAGKHVQDMLLGADPNGRQTPTRLRQMYHDLLQFFARKYAHVFGLVEGPPLHDPIAVAVLLSDHPDPEARIDFETRGEHWDVRVGRAGDDLGVTTARPASHGVTIPRSFDLAKFWHTLNDCMSRADGALLSRT